MALLMYQTLQNSKFCWYLTAFGSFFFSRAFSSGWYILMLAVCLLAFANCFHC